MFNKLSQRDKRTLLLGGAAVVVIVCWSLGLPWLRDWRGARGLLKAARQQLKLIAPGDDEKAAKAVEELARTVPVFEMPVSDSPSRGHVPQSVLFRDRFSQQLQKAGVKVKTLEYTGTRSVKRVAGYRLLRLECKGQCEVNQAFDLLAGLNENPYLVGIEDIQMKCDPKNRQNVELTLIVSTFAK